MTKQEHIHFWILDRYSFGRCACGATQQFYQEPPLGLTPIGLSILRGKGLFRAQADWLKERIVI